MNKNFQKIEKDLRSIAKRYKSVKYSIGLVILFLMMGLNAFSEEVNTGSSVSNSVRTITTREGIKDSVEGLQGKIKDARAENTKSIEALRLELIQLMEQGNQVVKSPWSSWQFGINYMYDNWSGTYKGSGDKPPKYIYNSIYRRGNWEERNALDVLAGKTVEGYPITPGNENTSAWQTATAATAGKKLKKDLSIDASTNGGREWGLVELRKIREPLNEVEILARVSPKEVKKDKLDIPVSVTPPATLSAPVVNPNVNKPTEAPKVDLPTQPNLEIAQAPTINNDPEIKVLTVNKVGAITVSTPEVTPVDFMLTPSGLTDKNSGRYFHGNQAGYTNYDLNNKNITVDYKDASGNHQRNYISTWGRVTGLDGVTTNVKVTHKDTRAFMIDEGIDYRDADIKPFRYIGTITLEETKTVGIDVQGTHTGSGAVNSSFTYKNNENAPSNIDSKGNPIKFSVANIQVINDGDIIGKSGYENQVAFGFNNNDASSNNTRTQMINRRNVTLGSKNSVGIQLRPEDPNAKGAGGNKELGLNMMTAENIGDNATITLNGAGSFGILTVKNKDLTKLAANSKSKDLAEPKQYTSVKIAEGGQIASRVEEQYQSAIINGDKSTITIQGDKSVGVGLLNSIQSVKIGGNINIGKNDPSSIVADANTGAEAGKVEGSVGVYTEVATRPVRAREFEYKDGKPVFESDGITHKVKYTYYDDHGNENIAEEALKPYNYTNSNNQAVNTDIHTGKTVGTETVEVTATITLGEYAQDSYGLRNSTKEIVMGRDSTGKITDSYTTSGSITLKSGGKVVVGGTKNYGAVSAGDNFKREVIRKLNNVGANVEQVRLDEVGKIDIESGAEIEVTGKQSIGYVMLSGEGTNAGTITVTGNNTYNPAATNYEGSLGFYGVKGKFYNTGTIKTEGNLAHAVVLKQTNPRSKDDKDNMIFNHYGEINVTSPDGTVLGEKTGNIGVLSDGEALVNFYNGAKVYVGDDSIGIHTSKRDAFNATFKNLGTLKIKIGKRSTFAYLDADGTETQTTLKEFFGNGKVNIESNMGEKSSLVYANNKAKALLDADLTIDKGAPAVSTIALLATNNSSVTVDSGKTLTTNTQVALAAVSGSTAENEGTIVSNRSDKGIGIYAKEAGSKGINKGTITMEEINAIGMYGKDVASLESSTGSNIKVKKTGSVGMYGVVSASATVPPFTVTNAGTIELEEGGSAGIYLVNKSTATDIIGNLLASNTGTIKLKSGEGSIGVYAPKATISNVGAIEIANTTKKSIAAYISDGGKITDASTANINLGTSGKNIAYYIKNAGTSIGGANVGTVKGYGVGVYLEGTKANPTATPAVPASQATLGANAPELKFNNGTTDGNGIIGLYLKGDTDISAYTKTITVGKTVGTNSAIGIYSDAQGTSGTGNEYTIKAKIKTGENAIGIFSAPGANKSYIKYLGSQMTLGEGSTGFYVNGKTELDTTNTTPTTTINLDGGLVAYVTENSEFVGGKNEVNLSKSGIGVYGERGAKVDVGSWSFNNNGHAAEEVRLKEGIAKVTTDKDLKPKMVLTHVINGETYLANGKTVKSIADPLHSAIEKEKNIGLMAQGIKNTKVGITWDKGNDYEIINEGTINFKDSIKSTA